MGGGLHLSHGLNSFSGGGLLGIVCPRRVMGGKWLDLTSLTLLHQCHLLILSRPGIQSGGLALATVAAPFVVGLLS
jgi:hypothetical protein